MSAAATIDFPITVLPPGPARKELTTEYFDRALKVTNQYPVSAEYNGAEGFSSPNIAWEDYSRMTTQQRKQSGERRLATPSWALNPAELRSLLVYYTERRAGLYKPQPGTERERLERAGNELANRSGRIEATLQKMCGEYIALNKSGENTARLKKVKEEIGNHDTQLRINQNIAAIVLQVVHLYFSVGLDSVGVGTELGLKPPHVRMILLRMHEAWARMNAWRGPHLRINVLGYCVPTKKRVSRSSKVNVHKAAQMRAEGILYREIALGLGVTVSSVVPALKRAGLWKRHERKPQAPKVPREPKPKLPKVPKIRTSKVDVQVAAKMIAEGKTYREIGLAFGVTSTAVLYTLRRAGLWKARDRNNVDVQVAANLIAEGKTYRAIGLVFGVQGRAVRLALRKAGLWFPFASRPKGLKPPKLPRKHKIDFAVAARMRNEGKSTTKIGTLFGVPLPTVRYFLKTRGLWKRAKVDVLRAAEMRSAGHTYQEIANTFGVSEQGLVCALQRAGLWKPSFRYYNVDLLKLALLFNANKSKHEMAASLGVPRWIIRQRLGQLGLWNRCATRLKPEPSFDANVAVEMYLAGKSVPQIARAFGYDERTGNNRTRTALIKAGVYQQKIKKAQAFAGPDSTY